MPTIRLEKAAKLYKGKGRHTTAVLNIDLQVEQGEFVFLLGSRGAGKSTLLDLIAGELAPDHGSVYLDNVDLRRATRRQLAWVRRCIGRVAQGAELVPTATVFQNMTSLRRFGALRGQLFDEPLIAKALALVGMPDCQERFPFELSLSECRRIQLARAILHSPPILLLDEITESMDDDTIWDMFQLLNEMNRLGTTVLMATSARKYVNIMRKRVITLADGKIVGDVRRGRYGQVRGTF